MMEKRAVIKPGETPPQVAAPRGPVPAKPTTASLDSDFRKTAIDKAAQKLKRPH